MIHAEVSKCSLLQCITAFFPAFFFLMEKEERKMKSIFNVYRGAWLNSLHSAETILNKLIFNEQPLCMRAKQCETLVSAEEKQTWSSSDDCGEKGFALSLRGVCAHCASHTTSTITTLKQYISMSDNISNLHLLYATLPLSDCTGICSTALTLNNLLVDVGSDRFITRSKLVRLSLWL